MRTVIEHLRTTSKHYYIHRDGSLRNLLVFPTGVKEYMISKLVLKEVDILTHVRLPCLHVTHSIHKHNSRVPIWTGEGHQPFTARGVNYYVSKNKAKFNIDSPEDDQEWFNMLSRVSRHHNNHAQLGTYEQMELLRKNNLWEHTKDYMENASALLLSEKKLFAYDPYAEGYLYRFGSKFFYNKIPDHELSLLVNLLSLRQYERWRTRIRWNSYLIKEVE